MNIFNGLVRSIVNSDKVKVKRYFTALVTATVGLGCSHRIPVCSFLINLRHNAIVASCVIYIPCCTCLPGLALYIPGG